MTRKWDKRAHVRKSRASHYKDCSSAAADLERRARQPSRRVVRAAAPGASYFVLVFDRTQLPEGSLPGPAHPVTDNELRDVVAPYWVVDDIRHARIHGNLPPDFEGFPGIELRDEPKGRKSIAAWLLSAHLEVTGRRFGWQRRSNDLFKWSVHSGHSGEVASSRGAGCSESLCEVR
jgi:hypothetical protein